MTDKIPCDPYPIVKICSDYEREGRQAHQDGVPLNKNPYRKGYTPYHCWMNGWYEREHSTDKRI